MASKDSAEDGSWIAESACPECGDPVSTTTTETVCTTCGLVVDEHPIDHGPEWRSFEDDNTNPKRTGAPLTPTRHDRGLSTEIGHKTDAKGNRLPGHKRRQLARLRQAHSRGRFASKRERNLAHGLREVRRIASALGLSESIRDQACDLFRRAQDADLLPGRSIESMAAASVYGICRCNGLSRMLEDVAAVAQCDRSKLKTAYNVLNTELGLPAKPRSPSEFVPRFASQLDVSNRVRQRALELADRAETHSIANGVQPAGVAAACLYAAAQEHGGSLTQGELADVAHTSTATIRTHWNAITHTCE